MALAVWLKALALWFAILVLAMLNGALRETALIPSLGSSAGLVVSGVILSSCVFVVAFFAVPWYGNLRSFQWLLVGLFWLVFTVVFEFGFGRFVQHNTWQEMLEAYTFRGGNMWPLVVAATLVSPWVAAKLRGVI